MSALARLTVEEFTTATARGCIFTVEFIKRTDGSRRVMNCRRGVSKGVTGAGRAFDPGPKALLPVWDMQVPEGGNGHRFVALDALLALRLGGKKYIWAQDAFVEAA